MEALLGEVELEGQAVGVLERVEQPAVHVLGQLHRRGVARLLPGLIQQAHEHLASLHRSARRTSW